MKFAQPIWLLAGVIACAALIWRYRRFDARQRAELRKFASESLIAQLTTSVSPGRRQLKRVLVVAGVACLALALARPLVGFRWEEAKRKGLDLLIAVDTSRSMLAQDVKPDRLTRAKMAVEDLLAKMDGDRVGLIAFAGNAFLQCPLTLDYDAFRQSLDVLDTKIIPRGGTDIASAIHEAEAALEGKGNNERILVLLTDGEDLEGSALEAARAAAKNGLRIFTVGIGSANGELIPLVDEKGGTEFVKDASGQFVKSHLDETMLKQIAEATGAMYQPLGQQAQGLETIYQKGLAKYTRHELASRMTKVYIERFHWPLALGLLCLVLEPLIGIRRFRNARRPAGATQPALFASWNKKARRPAPGVVAAGILPPGSALEHSSAPAMGRVIPPGRMPGSTAGKMPAATPARAVAAAAAALVVLGFASSAHASARTGEKDYQKGDYAKAEQEYRQAAAKSPDKPVLQFNLGAAAYKSGKFDAAAQSFAKAMKTDDLKLQQDDYYNLGNAHYRIGQKTEQANTQETIKNWEQAVQSYDAALQLKTDDADAKYNRDLVKRKLEALKKQQQNQQNNQQQSQDKNQQNKDQNKQNDSKDQQKQQNGGSGQQDKNDQTNNKDQQSQNKQQNKDQSKQDQKSGSGKDQKQPEQKKDDQQNGASGQQPKPEQANQKPEPKNPDRQAGQKQDKAKKDGQLQARNPQPKDAGQDQADAQREPGQMSREEARQLLDSLKSGDRKMPLEPSARDNAAVRNDEPLKDW
jgi:Ca-activated chloride channel family protein